VVMQLQVWQMLKVFGRGVLFVLLLCQSAMAAYDSDRIKQVVTEQHELFQVSGWTQTEQGWLAQSSLPLFNLIVGNEQTRLVSPYINPPQKKSAQSRCNVLARTVLQPANDEQLMQLEQVIRRATQYHVIKNLEMNGARFHIAPTMEGVYVKLICTVS